MTEFGDKESAYWMIKIRTLKDLDWLHYELNHRRNSTGIIRYSSGVRIGPTGGRNGKERGLRRLQRGGRLLGGECCVLEVRASAQSGLACWLQFWGPQSAIVSNSCESNLWSIRVSASSHIPTQWPSAVGQLVVVKSWGAPDSVVPGRPP